MFEPMFDPYDSILGFPPGVVTMAIGLAGCVVGLLWIRRIARVEEASSFRATKGPARDWLAVVAIVIVAALFGLLYVAVVGR